MAEDGATPDPLLQSPPTAAVTVRGRDGHDGDRAPGRVPLRNTQGLSPSQVERSLGLSPGAWRKRRLFALRATSQSLRSLGIVRGDFIIVEPGPRANAGRLVVVRGGGKSTLTLKRVLRDDGGPAGDRIELASPDPTQLPFPYPASPGEIVGTVIGTLPTKSNRRDARPAGADTQPARPGVSAEAHLRAANRKRSLSALVRWGRWLETPTQRGAGDRDAYRRTLLERLRILASCLDVSGETALYAALVREANRVLDAMRREARGWGGPPLQRLDEPLPRRSQNRGPVRRKSAPHAHRKRATGS